MRAVGVMAMLSLSVLLSTACSAPVNDRDEDTNTTQEQTAETAAVTEETMTGSTDSAVWFLDTGIEWTGEKETELQKRLREYYFRLDEPLKFIPAPDSGYLIQVRTFMDTDDGSHPVYFSAHDEDIMVKLKEEGIIDTYYQLKERDPGQQEYEPYSFMADRDNIEFWGRYFAMNIPASPQDESSSYEQLPEFIIASGTLTDFIRKPDMTKYIDSVDRRYFTFKGGSGEWDFEYQVDGTITFYRMDGRLSTESQCTNVLTASYKKGLDALNRTKELSISYETSIGGGSLSETMPWRDTVFHLYSGSRGGALERSDETVHVTVTMDGRTETFELVNENPESAD